MTRAGLTAAFGALALAAGTVQAASTDGIGAHPEPMPAPTMVVDRGTFCFATGNHAELHAGRMRLATPHADVAVLGTRFILEVNDSYTKVTVLEGKLEVTPHAGGTMTPVKPGQAATATATRVHLSTGPAEIPKKLPPGNCG